MSLTSFLRRNQDVRERFRQQFRKPPADTDMKLLAPPISKRYNLVGTGFDYLLRFYLKCLNPQAVESPWVAEYCLSHPLSPLLDDVVVEANIGVVSYRETELTKKASGIIEHAKAEYASYPSSGRMTDDLMKSALALAQLDPIFRARFVDENIGMIEDEDVEDLRKLLSIVPTEPFVAHQLCLLDPTFGEASRLVGGADADLVIDDALIDVKTTKKSDFQTPFFHQLMGYVVLHEIGGAGGLTPKPPIRRAGIYFARHAHLKLFDLDEVMDPSTLPEFIDWFKLRAAKEYPGAALKPL